MGVDIGGAGDQGIMFGYACDETEEYMPYAISMAHKLSKKLTEVKHELSILNVDEISLDVRINKTYDFHDFDVAYGKTKKVMDYYLSRIESII